MKEYTKISNITGEEILMEGDTAQIKDMDKHMKAAYNFCKNFNGGCPEVFEDEEEFFNIIDKKEFERWILWFESVSNSDKTKQSFYDYVVCAYDNV